MLIEILLLLIDLVIGYNIRYERQAHAENLVLEEVDAKVRRDLEVARNLNDSLRKDVAELKARLATLQRGGAV